MDIEKAVEDIMEQVSEVGDDTASMSQEDSAEFYEGVAAECVTRARTIREEME